MAGEYVLLTGATGMIGFKTLVDLLAAGYKVRAAVRNQAGFDKIKGLKSVVPYASQLESIIVPDITALGAYDEAVKGGIKYIVHVASPLTLALPEGATHEEHTIKPAELGTLRMLESAVKVNTIEKIVITASILSITSLEYMASGTFIDDDTRSAVTHGPFSDSFTAYNASKARAFEVAEKFIVEQKPSFNIIHIMPTFVLGRDELVTDPADIAKGTNALLFGPLLGHANPDPLLNGTVHLDDVAQAHVNALKPSVKGNQNFIVNYKSPEGTKWGDSFEIVKKHFPKAYADGVFKFDGVTPTQSVITDVSSAKATEVLGIHFKSFEEQTVSAVSYFLELLGRKE